MEDAYNFAELTKNMITSRLKESADAPTMAAEIAKTTIISGVKSIRGSRQDAMEAVRQICFGAMSGLLLIEKDLPLGTIKILQSLTDVSQELQIEPSELMTGAMESVARVSRLVSAETRWKIREALEENFNGTGEVFDKLCEKFSRR